MKDELFVFAPLLALEGGLNKTLLFCVDGQYFSVKVYEGKNEYLTLKTAESEDKKTQSVRLEKNEADRDVVTYTTDKIENKLYISLQKNEIDLLSNSIFFIRKSYQKYSNPTEYIMFKNNESNTSIELDQKDLSNSVSKNEKYNVDVQITLFGGGSIGFDLDLKLI